MKEETHRMTPLILEVATVGPIQANCYILGCPETRAALLIDPGDEPDALAALLETHKLKPVAYLHTHGHLDHVGATRRLKERLGGEILLHEADLFLYAHAHEHAREYGFVLPQPLPVDRYLRDGDEVVWGAAAGRVLHTPGHSPGGICLRVPGGMTGDAAGPDWVFTGDTLFQGSIGRTDLPGGSLNNLLQAIREKLLLLPDETVIASGHGPLTTIGMERKLNPFLQGDI
jgi:glyoxylase-like metal-dependent hydrolase (beta-lactamase superfamily II)